MIKDFIIQNYNIIIKVRKLKLTQLSILETLFVYYKLSQNCPYIRQKTKKSGPRYNPYVAFSCYGSLVSFNLHYFFNLYLFFNDLGTFEEGSLAILGGV